MITKELKGTKAITLIAMVISILVLLILAGVSVGLLVGENGITGRAVTARKTYDIAGAKEKLELDVSNYAIEFYQAKYVNGGSETSGTVGGYILGKFTSNSDFEEDYTLTKEDNKITITNKKDASQSATATIDENGKVLWSGTKTQKNEFSVGDTITYTTKLNGTDLTMDWKVFHKETISGTDYVWIILGDYLPNSYVNISNTTLSGSYEVYSDSSRTDLINAMTDTTNWNSLLKGTINGTAIDYTSTEDTNIKAMGSPTLELWKDSWNASYPNKDTTYTTNQLYISSNATGFLVSRTNNPPTSLETYVNMSGTEGYKSGSNADVLYFPHTSSWNNTGGYWLASPSANGTDYVLYVYCDGNMRGMYYDAGYAFRPVVCLPFSVLE